MCFYSEASLVWVPCMGLTWRSSVFHDMSLYCSHLSGLSQRLSPDHLHGAVFGPLQPSPFLLSLASGKNSLVSLQDLIGQRSPKRDLGDMVLCHSKQNTWLNAHSPHPCVIQLFILSGYSIWMGKESWNQGFKRVLDLTTNALLGQEFEIYEENEGQS